MPGPLITELILGVFLLPFATVLFANIFWRTRRVSWGSSNRLAFIWGISNIFWFVGVLLILPVWYLRMTYQAPPDWRVLFPFLVSTVALMVFCRKAWKEFLNIIESLNQTRTPHKATPNLPSSMKQVFNLNKKQTIILISYVAFLLAVRLYGKTKPGPWSIYLLMIVVTGFGLLYWFQYQRTGNDDFLKAEKAHYWRGAMASGMIVIYCLAIFAFQGRLP